MLLFIVRLAQAYFHKRRLGPCPALVLTWNWMWQKHTKTHILWFHTNQFIVSKLLTTFEMKRYADIQTSYHPHTSSVPHVSLATSHVLIHPWTTVERWDPVWTPYHGTGTADQADLVKLGSRQLNLMSLHSTLVCRQLPIIEHKIDRHGGRSWKRQRPLDKPHDDDDDELLRARPVSVV